MSAPEPGLFAEPDHTVPIADDRTPGQRRRDRHLAFIALGQHPLSAMLGFPLPLHPDARRDGDREDDGTPRCGSCVHRAVVGHHSRSYPKCLAAAYDTSRRAYPWETGRHVVDGRVPFVDYPRASHSEASDVAAWWPACHDYKLRDPS